MKTHIYEYTLPNNYIRHIVCGAWEYINKTPICIVKSALSVNLNWIDKRTAFYVGNYKVLQNPYHELIPIYVKQILRNICSKT